jgi:hypothetical protein
MYPITLENFSADGAISIEDRTLDFLQEQAKEADGEQSAVSLNPNMRFYGHTESEAMALAAAWTKQHVNERSDGVDIMLLATWSRYLEEEDRPYEVGLLLAVA